MSKLYIVEGPDCTGKTSLAKFIALKKPAIYMHASGHRDLHMPMLTYHKNMIENAKVNLANGRDVVFDRHWPSEWCYGQILRKHISDRFYSFPLINDLLLELIPTYIFCESHESYKRMAMSHEQEDHRYTKEQYVMICGEYVALRMDMERLKAIKVHRYSIEDHGAEMQKFLDEVTRAS